MTIKRVTVKKNERGLLLRAMQDIDGHLLAALDTIERARPMGKRHQHQERVERDARKRVERHPLRGTAMLGRDDGDAGGKGADGVTEGATLMR